MQLSQREQMFLMNIITYPGAKMDGSVARDDEGLGLWMRLEAEGLITSTGSYRWQIVPGKVHLAITGEVTAIPTFAMNANGKPLSPEQVELIRRAKLIAKELDTLVAQVRHYNTEEHMRLRQATFGHTPETNKAVFDAHDDFYKAKPFVFLDRGLSDVEVGIMAIVRSIARPVE